MLVCLDVWKVTIMTYAERFIFQRHSIKEHQFMDISFPNSLSSSIFLFTSRVCNALSCIEKIIAFFKQPSPKQPSTNVPVPYRMTFSAQADLLLSIAFVPSCHDARLASATDLSGDVECPLTSSRKLLVLKISIWTCTAPGKLRQCSSSWGASPHRWHVGWTDMSSRFWWPCACLLLHYPAAASRRGGI